MALVIKKAVDLSSLGEAYQGITLNFKSIPAKNLPELEKGQKDIGEDTKKIMTFFLNILQEYFIDGKQQDTALVKEDINELDAQSIMYCFQILTGQAEDPKSSSESTTTFSTEAEQA